VWPWTPSSTWPSWRAVWKKWNLRTCRVSKAINTHPNGSCRQKKIHNNESDPLEPFSNAQTLDSEKVVLRFMDAVLKEAYDRFPPRPRPHVGKERVRVGRLQERTSDDKRMKGSWRPVSSMNAPLLPQSHPVDPDFFYRRIEHGHVASGEHRQYFQLRYPRIGW